MTIILKTHLVQIFHFWFDNTEKKPTIGLGFVKIISLIFLGLASIMTLVALSSNHWLEGNKLRRGLWSYCVLKPNGVEKCQSTLNEMWVTSCGVLCVVAFLFILLSLFLFLLHVLMFSNKSVRRTTFVFVIVFNVFALCSLLSCLVAFPVIFIRNQLEQQQGQFKIYKWSFGWSYGLAWGSFIFLSGTFVVAFLDPLTFGKGMNEKSKRHTARSRSSSSEAGHVKVTLRDDD